MSGLDRKPGELLPVDKGKKFEIVKTNIILDLEEKASRQKLAMEKKKERLNNRKRKKGGNGGG